MLKREFSQHTNKGEAIKQLQGITNKIITGVAAAADIRIAGLLGNDHLVAVIGFDGDNATPALSVKDFTATSAITPVAETADAIEGITLPSAAEVSINITGHGFEAGDSVAFDGAVGGAVELRNNTYTVLAATDANNFTLTGTDGDDFTAWTAGGNVTPKNAGRLACSDDTSGYQLWVQRLVG